MSEQDFLDYMFIGIMILFSPFWIPVFVVGWVAVRLYRLVTEEVT